MTSKTTLIMMINKTCKTSKTMMINKTSKTILTMMISAMMIRGARIWEHLRGGGRLHYLAGSARAERRGQPVCSTPPHRYHDDAHTGVQKMAQVAQNGPTDTLNGPQWSKWPELLKLA